MDYTVDIKLSAVQITEFKSNAKANQAISYKQMSQMKCHTALKST